MPMCSGHVRIGPLLFDRTIQFLDPFRNHLGLIHQYWSHESPAPGSDVSMNHAAEGQQILSNYCNFRRRWYQSIDQIHEVSFCKYKETGEALVGKLPLKTASIENEHRTLKICPVQVNLCARITWSCMQGLNPRKNPLLPAHHCGIHSLRPIASNELATMVSKLHRHEAGSTMHV